jgi:serine/threonine-protein kinase
VTTLGEGAMVGPYRVGRLLGRGGMAVVHEATHESIGRTVALKLVSPSLEDPGFVDRFRREGRMQAALDHPNVVTVYEAGTSEYGPYLAMRLIRGTTLAQLVDDGALTTERTLRLVAQVADALDAAHAAGLVHRDVKPRNVLVGEGDHAYLADFGLTRRSDAGAATATGFFMGTLAYAAPEVLRGGIPGPAADRYALAAMIFECLTGTTVFPRPSHAAVVYAHTNEPPPRVSGRRQAAPRALDEALIAGLAKDPGERPPSAAALVERVRDALDGRELGPAPPRVPAVDADDATTTGASALPAGVAPRRPARNRRRLGLVAVATAAALAGGGAVALLDRDGGDSARAALPSAPVETMRLGSDLAADGRTVACDGAAVTPGSPPCSIFQKRLPGATLVVPRDGVVRRWGVRSATGELALSVLRRRDEGYFQIARSRNEFVGSRDPHLFPADIAVEQGDRLGLVVVEGSGIGMREAEDATTGRWTPPLRGLIRSEQEAEPGELLLRVDYLPGGTQAQPEALTGAAAAAAPAGEVLARSRARGAPVELRVVMTGSQGALDVVRGGRRVARIAIPYLRAPVGDTLQLIAGVEDPSTGQVGIDVRFTRPDSQRLLGHYVVYVPGEGIRLIN